MSRVLRADGQDERWRPPVSFGRQLRGSGWSVVQAGSGTKHSTASCEGLDRYVKQRIAVCFGSVARPVSMP